MLSRAPSLLRENPEFRQFWTGQTVSLFGDQITQLAVPLAAVLVLDAGPAQMGYLTAANLVPYLLFSLHAGAWVDRRGRRRQVMIGADLGRGLLVATVPVAYAVGALTIAQLYAVAFLTGALSMLFFVSQSTLFVSLVPRKDYVEANSFLHGSRAFSYVGGPPVAGLLVQLLSAPYALVADAISFLVSVVFLRRIDPVEPPTSADERGRVVAGARFILHSPIVRSSLAATATINFFNFAFFALFILYATRYLHVRPGLLGVVLVPLAGGPKPARAGDALSRGVRFRPRRDGARHQHRLDLRRPDPESAQSSGLGCLPRRKLRHQATGIRVRRRAR